MDVPVPARRMLPLAVANGLHLSVISGKDAEEEVETLRAVEVRTMGVLGLEGDATKGLNCVTESHPLATIACLITKKLR
jgi:hypothetical protein